MDPRIEVVYADGTSESFVLEKEEVVLGRSLEADISIPDARELEPQHLMLKRQQGGCWVAAAQGAQTPTLVSAKPFQSGQLPWGSELQIGPLVIVLTGEEATAKRSNIGIWVLALVVLGTLFGIYVWKESRGQFVGPSTPRNYPNIMPSPVPCSVEAQVSESRGKTALDAALAKSDRYPFDPQDGIEAIRLYTEAAACLTIANNTALAARAVREGQAMQNRVMEDYRTKRLSLDLVMDRLRSNPDDTDALQEATRELNALYRLVEHTNTDYKAELQQVATWVALQTAKNEKSGKKK
ncbi:MAG: FHA domain-containing protein [Polyangiales bacterium]|nr:hypothetical protein [Myxococcales bacterium]